MVFSEQLENLFFFMLSVNFAQSKQEKFNISNTPEYPPELFNFGIKRFGGRVCTPVVKIIQNSFLLNIHYFCKKSIYETSYCQ